MQAGPPRPPARGVPPPGGFAQPPPPRYRGPPGPQAMGPPGGSPGMGPPPGPPGIGPPPGPPGMGPPPGPPAMRGPGPIPPGMPHGPVLGMPPPVPPLPPPSFFPGSSSLFEQLDKKLLVVLRDGRHLVGTMRSYDQFSNIVLEDTHERHFVGDLFGDIPLGLYLVRGDSMVLLGELDEAREEEGGRLKRVSRDEIIEAQQRATEADRQADSRIQLSWEFGDGG